MTRFVRGMDALRIQWGACVLVVHHSGVSEDAKMRARGSGAVRGAADTEFALLKRKDGIRDLYFLKGKDWEVPDQPETYKLHVVELPKAWAAPDALEPATSAVMVPCDESAAAGAPILTDLQTRVLAVVDELTKFSGAVSRKEVNSILLTRMVVTDRRERHQVLKALHAKHLLIVDTDSVTHCGNAAALMEKCNPIGPMH
jgi:hypothetical protein